MTSSRKGAMAEAEIAAAFIGLGLVVLRPLCEGARYDLAIDTGVRLLRVQCKWASVQRGVALVRCATSRHTTCGYVRGTYTAAEIDALAAFAPATDRCYLIPIQAVEGLSAISLRLGPTANNQATNVRWARDYELETSVRLNWPARSGDNNSRYQPAPGGDRMTSRGL